MTKLLLLWQQIIRPLNQSSNWIATLFLRLILAWEFFEAGLMKLNGENWFENIKENFPFPFNLISTEISWFIATWFEVLGGIGLALGLFTRFWSLSLIILSIVAIFGVHWPTEWNTLSDLLKGYTISDNGFGNYKLPLLFIVMLIPLLLQGSGKLSIDHWLNCFFRKIS
ncbi:HvfX family Cu-binding RiPP maturation protein [Aliikangiella sp. IMCC44359]|uniref:HvfX family Cu-binding RiPP maturation protein n=1 Tax=Aliikangiella sp. IMCC44359 TaxID=3459125 RepID=UPI00403AE895